MTSAYDELLDAIFIVNDLIPAFVMCFMRIGAATYLLPAVGEMFVPVRVKTALVISMVFLMAPGLEVSQADFTVLNIINEAILGLFLGFGVRLMIFALQIAGSIASQSLSLAQMFNGAGIEPQPVISNILVLFGVTIFLMMGGLERCFALIFESYNAFPVGYLLDVPNIAKWSVEGVKNSFNLAFSLAAPFVISALLYNFALGAINRAMPQLMVVMIGAPALTWGGLVLLMLTAPIIIDVWSDLTMRSLILPVGP